MHWVLGEYLKKYKFGTIADYLGCDLRATALPAPPLREDSGIVVHTSNASAGDRAPRTPVTIVVPCFNERPALPYLANTLDSVGKLLGRDYVLSLIFVDDGSDDGTWEVLNRLFGNRENCRLVQHPRNLGVAAAILTGIRHANTEIVCSIDCDCVPSIKEGAILISASSKRSEFMFEKECIAVTRAGNNVHRYTDNGRFFYVLSGGFPINFEDGSVIGGMLDAIYCELFVCLREIAERRLAAGLRMSWPAIHYEVAEAWCRAYISESQ